MVIKVRERIKGLRILPLLIVVAGILCGIAPYSGAKSKESEDARRQAVEKSRYYYYEGLKQELLGNNDGAYECYNRAVKIDPQNMEASYALGNLALMMAPDEYGDYGGEYSLPQAVEMLRKYVDKYPGDIDEGMMYGYLTAYFDTTRDESIRVLERLNRLYPERGMILVYLSQAYQSAGDVKNAVEMMNRYERLEGKSAQTSMHKMSLLMEGQDTVGALQEADKLLASDSTESIYWILKGNLFDVINAPDSALAMYLKAEALSPETSAPKLALMESYRNRGDSTAYDNKVYEVLLTEDLQPEEKTGLLAQYLQKLVDDKSDTQRGDTLFRVLESQYPHEPELLILSARYKWAKNDTVGAIEAMSYALDMHPDSPEDWQRLVYYQSNSGREEDALITIDRAEEKVGLNIGMKLYKGFLLNNLKRYNDALDMYKSMVSEIDSGLSFGKRMTLRDVRRDIRLEELNLLSTLYQAMGDSEHAKGDTLQSFEYFETALEFNPENTLAANNYAYFLALSGKDLEKAQQLSEQSLKNGEENNPTNLDTYAWILYLRGDYDKAYEIQSKAMELMKESGDENEELIEHYEAIKKARGIEN